MLADGLEVIGALKRAQIVRSDSRSTGLVHEA
jgi:hypothetical protein